MSGRGTALSSAQWVGDIQGFPTGLPPGSNQNREGDSIDKALGVESSVCWVPRSKCNRKWCQRGTQMTSCVGSETLVNLVTASCWFIRIPETDVLKEQDSLHPE